MWTFSTFLIMVKMVNGMLYYEASEMDSPLACASRLANLMIEVIPDGTTIYEVTCKLLPVLGS
jgi:hypothetical protein